MRGHLIRPQARRVLELRHAGHPVRPEDSFVLVSNNYRIGGTLGIAPPARADILLENHILCTEVLRRFIEATGTVTRDALRLDEADLGWEFVPMPGASVIFDSGAMAGDHLDEAAALHPEFLGLTEEGFRRYRLHL